MNKIFIVFIFYINRNNNNNIVYVHVLYHESMELLVLNIKVIHPETLTKNMTFLMINLNNIKKHFQISSSGILDDYYVCILIFYCQKIFFSIFSIIILNKLYM